MLFFIFLSCSEKEENLPPTVSINIQEEDLKLIDGYDVELRADVADPNDPLEDLSVRWLVGGVTACDWTLGGDTCSYAIGIDQIDVRVQVRDPEGLEAEDFRFCGHPQ